jgi:hypothetical protein
MGMLQRFVPALILCAIMLALGRAPAVTSSIPSIPGLPPLSKAAKDVVSKTDREGNGRRVQPRRAASRDFGCRVPDDADASRGPE